MYRLVRLQRRFCSQERQSNSVGRQVFSQSGPGEVHFCTVVSDGVVSCGDNAFDCPIPQVPQAFFVRNRANGPWMHKVIQSV